MLNRKLLLIAALMLAACTADPETEPGSGKPESGMPDKIVNTSVDAMRGTLLVYFDDDAVADIERTAAEAAKTRAVVTRSGIVSVDEVLSGLDITSLNRVFTYDRRNDERMRAAGLHKWYTVSFDETTDLDAAALKLAAVSEIQHVQFNTKLHLASDKKVYPFRENATSATRAANPSFNDPMLSYQWHYANTGDASLCPTVRAGADIDVQEAWKLTTGDPSIIVAIVDEGVKYTHPDLAANMWVNTAEANGTPGVDDDGNGFVDDVHGYNFVTKGVISWDVDPGEDDGDSGHGTHVAGTVAAVNNNGVGVCGVAGGTGNGDGVRLMSCQLFSGGYGGTTEMTANAVTYAANNGASILQCSFGNDSGIFRSDNAYDRNSLLERQAFDYFIATKNCKAIDGGVVVFAAGNETGAMSGYPGAYRNYISVTSFSPDYQPAYYTNYGPGCNIAAPGGDVYVSPQGKQTACVLSTLTSEANAGSDYGYMQGTSMACPHVSGVVALGLSYALAKGKHYTLDEFKSMLFTSVNDIDVYLTGTKQSKFLMNLSNYYRKMGTGAVDAYQLLMQMDGTPCLKVSVGSKQLIPLNTFFGSSAGNLTYLDVVMSQDDMNKLGLSEAPSVISGKLQIKCAKPGVAKITISAIAGGATVGTGSTMGGMEITKEFAIIARSVETANGGWL